MRALFATALCVIWAGVAHATLPVGSFAGHMSLDEVNQFFSSLSTQYPSHAQPSMTIGASVEGRDIQATCIGACGRDNSAKFLVTSMHHAREVRSLRFRFGVLTDDNECPHGACCVLWLFPPRSADVHDSCGLLCRQSSVRGCGWQRRVHCIAEHP